MKKLFPLGVLWSIVASIFLPNIVFAEPVGAYSSIYTILVVAYFFPRILFGVIFLVLIIKNIVNWKKYDADKRETSLLTLLALFVLFIFVDWWWT